MVAFDSKRYVGAQIGVHGPTGEKVGEVKRLRNVEYLFLAGEPERVAAATAAVAAGRPAGTHRAGGCLTRTTANGKSRRTPHVEDETMEPYDCAGCGLRADR